MKRDHKLLQMLYLKLSSQATQQPTSTVTPSSTVNVMSNKEDHCFQCKELGHIAHHCPSVLCFKCDEYGHIVVDCQHRTAPSGMSTQTEILKYTPQ